MRVGQSIWIFDSNRRVYNKDRSGPIFREYFISCCIVGENRSSWLLEGRYRIDKKTNELREGGKYGLSRRVYESAEAVSDACFVDANRHALADKVHRCSDPSVLRQIKVLLDAALGPPQKAD